jgi:hypothetical protein
MSNDMDANIKLLYPVDKNSFFTIDDVGQGKEFDVIANVEIGEDLNEVVNRHEVRVGIVNLTQSRAVGVAQTRTDNLVPQNNTPRLEEVRVAIPAGWDADAEPGDVLQAIASYKVVAGVNIDFSTAQSVTFVVS